MPALLDTVVGDFHVLFDHWHFATSTDIGVLFEITTNTEHFLGVFVVCIVRI
jgi:hypothetical protein